MEDKRYCVYMHTNKINGKMYIGITGQKPRKRWKNGYGYDTGCYFRNAIDKYGWDNFEHTILMTHLLEEQAKIIEIELIHKYNTTNRDVGYNRTLGGDGNSGSFMTEETKEKLREFNLGKTLSEETKQKMSKSRMGDKNWKAKKVKQYTVDGKFIKLWDCISDAARELGIGYKAISKACCGKSNTSGGYKWILVN